MFPPQKTSLFVFRVNHLIIKNIKKITIVCLESFSLWPVSQIAQAKGIVPGETEWTSQFIKWFAQAEILLLISAQAVFKLALSCCHFTFSRKCQTTYISCFSHKVYFWCCSHILHNTCLKQCYPKHYEEGSEINVYCKWRNDFTPLSPSFAGRYFCPSFITKWRMSWSPSHPNHVLCSTVRTTICLTLHLRFLLDFVPLGKTNKYDWRFLIFIVY